MAARPASRLRPPTGRGPDVLGAAEGPLRAYKKDNCSYSFIYKL